MAKLLKKIFSFLPFVLIGLSMLIIFQYGYAISVGEVPSVFNRAISYVATPSMEDEIMAGDIIVIRTKFDDIEAGDIISFNTTIDGQEVVITHKVDSVNPQGLITTYGVNNNGVIYDWEKDISPDQVVGIYTGMRSHFLGTAYASLFSGNLNILFLLIILIFVIIFVLELIHLVKILQEKKLEEERLKLVEEAKKQIIENEEHQ